MHRKRSFTLIEALVVMTIVGILATIIFSISGSARLHARDARRKTDLGTMKVAIVIYRQQYGVYPLLGVGGADCSFYTASWTSLSAALKPFIDILPTDPRGHCAGNHPWFKDTVNGNVYIYETNTILSPTDNRYSIWAALENVSDQDRNDSASPTDPTGGKYVSYTSYYNIGTNGNNNVDALYMIGCHTVTVNATTICQDN